jgi:hypothetical protein
VAPPRKTLGERCADARRRARPSRAELTFGTFGLDMPEPQARPARGRSRSLPPQRR